MHHITRALHLKGYHEGSQAFIYRLRRESL